MPLASGWSGYGASAFIGPPCGRYRVASASFGEAPPWYQSEPSACTWARDSGTSGVVVVTVVVVVTSVGVAAGTTTAGCAGTITVVSWAYAPPHAAAAIAVVRRRVRGVMEAPFRVLLRHHCRIPFQATKRRHACNRRCARLHRRQGFEAMQPNRKCR